MTNKRTRGFAAMDPEKQRAIASKGGKAAHAKGTAHRFTTEEASEAGRKGGRAAHARGTAHRFTTEEASEAGRKGGSSRSAATRQPHEAGAEEPRKTELREGQEPTERAGEAFPSLHGGSSERHGSGLPTGEQPGRQNEQNVARQALPAVQPTINPQSTAR
jgi:general stress protein YciG